MEVERCQKCYLCGTSKEDKKRRSRLSNPDLQGHLQRLASLINEVSSGVDTGKLQEGYGCKSCISSLDKYDQLHKKFCTNLCNAIPVLPKTSTSTVAGITSTSASVHATLESPVVVSETASPAMTVSYLAIR
jgi:hypothetical protein